MLNTLFQIQLTDPMTVLALLAMAAGGGIAVYSGLAAYRTHDMWRQWAYGIGAFLALYTAAAYYIVLFVDAAANVAWLRPAILFWMLHYVIVTRVIALVITTSPSEQMKAEVARLNVVVANAQSNTNTWKGLVDGYKEREGKLNEAVERATADRQSMIQSLSDTRSKLAQMLEQKMELEAKAMHQEQAINALKRQVVEMELQLRKVVR